MPQFTEFIVEEACLAWPESLGYAILHGPNIAVGEPTAEPACACTHADRRSDSNYRDVVLEGRLRQALVRLDPDLFAATSAVQSVSRPECFCMKENKDEYTKL